MLVLIIVAFVAGLVTAVSPCVLPILPIVLATGADGDRRRPYLVIAGLIASFSFFTLASVQIIQALHLPSSTLRDIAIVVIAVFGLTLLVPALTTGYERLTARLPDVGVRLARPGVAGGLITGVGLGLVWTPCAGPILGAITSLAVTQPGSGATLTLVVVYSIGAGLPLLAIALGGRAALARLRMRSASAWASKVFGVLVLATAGLMAVGADSALSADLTSALPDWTGTLQTLERVGQVQSALGGLGVGQQSSLVPSPNTSPGPGGSVAPLPVGQPAPDFAGIDHWLNSKPLTMASLKGKVVLVDFWTYSCINCIRTLPYVEGWYQKYAADGLVVVGVHTPEFAFEHDTANVQAGISRFGITYPVAQDNEYTTWTAYSNSYWPADYLIDASGHVRATHDGEGDYNTTEAEIRSLLTEAEAKALPGAAPSASPPPITQNQSPETYLGTDRQSGYVTAVPANGVGQFSFPSSLPPNDEWAVSGKFDFEAQFMQATAAGDKLEYSFSARDVYLVMSADSPAAIRVSVTGAGNVGSTEDIAADGSGTVGPARLYHLVHLNGLGHGTVTITFNPGIRAYAFTFGS
jgi:cytochrome c biogenesis protein CcdA/thiol-disulfide isomerase/thioredoxin